MDSIGWIFNLLVVLLANGSTVTRGQGGKFVLCHFEGASAVRSQEEVRFTPEDLDVSICTHVVYNRAVVSQGLEVVPKDRAVDLWEDGGRGMYNRTQKLKELKPELKIFIDVYDGNGELGKVAIAENRSSLAHFARNAADFVQNLGFDGMCFRPKNYSEGFDDVAAVLHEEFVRREIKLMTFLLPQRHPLGDKFEMTEPLSRNFDLIVLGTYWMLPTEQSQIFSPLSELERTVAEHFDLGVPREKLVVAIPAFSVSMKLCDRSESGVGSRVCGGGDEGSYEPPKMIFYNSELMRKIANTSEDWVIERDQLSQVLYGHSKSLEWTSFEDAVSVRAKAIIILRNNLAGVSIMNVDQEDFKGLYAEGGGAFPLTRAAFEALKGTL